MSSTSNPEITKARQELELLMQREKELEERLGFANKLLNDDHKEKTTDKIIPNQNGRVATNRPRSSKNPFNNNQRNNPFINQTNNFEDFFYRETSNHREKYDDLSNAMYTKQNEERRAKTIKSTDDQMDDYNIRNQNSNEDIDDGQVYSLSFKSFVNNEASDDELDKGQPRSNPYKKNNNETSSHIATLVSLSDDDEDSEIARVFNNDNQENDNNSTIAHDNDVDDETYEYDLMMQQGQAHHQQQGMSKKYSKQDYQDDDEDEEESIISDEMMTSNDTQRAIRRDIQYSLQRERELQYERGSLENLDQISNSDGSDVTPTSHDENVREKIMREIEAEKLRELELQASYKNKSNVNYYSAFDDDDDESVVHNDDDKDSRDLIASEIQQLQEREEELRVKYNGFIQINNEEVQKSDNEEEEMQFSDPRERIEHEIRLQREREIEINQLHRTLSNENLLFIDQYDHDNDSLNDESNVNRNLDARGKIVREMEELRIREEEVRLTQAKNKDYDIIELQQTLDGDAQSENNNDEEELDTRDKINKEIYEIQQREEELKKKYMFSGWPSFQHISSSQNDSEEEEKQGGEEEEENVTAFPARGLIDTNKKKFGSREDLVAFFGTTTHKDEEESNESKPKFKLNPIKIPEAFTTSENASSEISSANTSKTNKRDRKLELESSKTNGIIQDDLQTGMKKENIEQPDGPDMLSMFDVSERLIQNGHQKQYNSERIAEEEQYVFSPMNVVTSEKIYEKEPYFHDEMKPISPSKKRIVFRRKSTQSVPNKGLISLDVKKEEKRMQKFDGRKDTQIKTSVRLNIHPIAAKWERKGEEERKRKLQIELELQKRKEERMKNLKRKAELERHIRLLEEEEREEKQKREDELKLLKVKQQGLNQLWYAKKPVVTVLDNSDHDDQYLLLQSSFEQTQQMKSPSSTARHSVELLHPSLTSQKKPLAKPLGRSFQEKPTAESLGGAAAILRKIQRWEKKIAKNSNQQ